MQIDTDTGRGSLTGIRRIFVSVLTALSILGCSGQTEKPAAYHVIDLVHAERETVPLSRIFDKIEYVRLETTPQSLTDIYATIYLTDKYIVTTQRENQAAHLFDRNSGKYIKRIGNQGNGPGEYYGIIQDGAFDEKGQVLYFEHGEEWLGIQIETGEKYTIKKSTPAKTDEEFFYIPNFCRIDSNRYAGYVNNISGNNPTLMIIFDDEGRILKTFRNYQTFTRTNHNSFSFYSGQYYGNGRERYFKEKNFNDTIYRITCDSLVPYAVFYCGDKSVPYQEKEKSGDAFDLGNRYRCSPVCESDRYLVFAFLHQKTVYTGYLDKTTGKTFVCNAGEQKNGFAEDLSKTPLISAFCPRSGNSRHECYMIVDAAQIAAFTAGKDLSETPLKNIGEIREDDNPILVIATLRE